MSVLSFDGERVKLTVPHPHVTFKPISDLIARLLTHGRSC